MNIFRLFKCTRYFVVSYAYKNAPGWGFGTIGVSVRKGGYPSMEYIISHQKMIKRYSGVTILNIIELSRQDYDAFFSEAE